MAANTGKIDAAKPERVIAVRGDYITLGQLLKVAGLIGTGGEVKSYLATTAIQVNGEAEQRRGRKLRPGDVVVAPGGVRIRLIGANGEENASDE